ncbi:MAG: hypothetical protein E6I58_14465 [Chloroflexi bacterium]|nr:MAG: hypothetical protein E6I58_14465 [Chloroflexota bacterium]
MAALAMLLAGSPVAAATDLTTLLANPPGTDWVDVGPAADRLVGTFSSHDYALFLKAAGSSPGSIETELNLDGFTRGYGLEWEQRGTQDLLVERVFEFKDSRGAGFWYGTLKSGSERAKQYTRAIPIPASLPNSFGAVLYAPGNGYQYRVEFVKGNLVFVVHMDSDVNDLSRPAVTQAAAMFEAAPARTDVPPGAGQAVNDLVRNVEIAAGALIVFLAFVAAGAVLLVTRRRRQTVGVLPGGLTMSADGAYWWDGAQWREASMEVPSTAQRSPDGAYWWDGRAWRPSPSTRPSG